MSEPKHPSSAPPNPTSDGGPGGFMSGQRTSDGGPGGRAANSLFAGAGGVPPFMAAPPAGWAQHVPQSTNTMVQFGGHFPDDGWDPLMKAGIIAGRFARAVDVAATTDPGPPPDNPSKHAATVAETSEDIAKGKLLEDLQSMIYPDPTNNPRPDRMAEILEQEIGFTGYYYRLLGCSTEVRPNSFLCVLIGIQVGALVCSHWKWQYRRQRPAQAWPAIHPVIATPRHPSYPSGHAMQAYMIAHIVGDIAPTLAGLAEQMAARIAENRVVAGVHYPSDSEGAMISAGLAFAQLKTFGDYQTVRNAAFREMNGSDWPTSPIVELTPLFPAASSTQGGQKSAAKGKAKG